MPNPRPLIWLIPGVAYLVICKSGNAIGWCLEWGFQKPFRRLKLGYRFLIHRRAGP